MSPIQESTGPGAATLPSGSAIELFRRIFSHGLEAALLMRPRGDVLAANAAACKVFGTSERELFARSLATSHVADADSGEHLLRMLRADEPAHGELAFLRADGLRFDVEVSSVPFMDEAGERASILTVRDISALRVFERLTQESETRLGFALEAAQIGDWDRDLRTNVVRRSLRYHQCFGYTEPVPAWGYDTFLAHVHPLDRSRVDDCHQKAMAGLGNYDVEYRAQWPDGSVHWLWSRGHFYFDEEGKPYRVAGIVVDISERRSLIEAHRLAEERLELAFRGSTDAAWDLNLRTSESYYSPRWLQMVGHEGLPPEGLTESFWEQVTHPDDRQRVRSSYEEVLRGSEVTFEIEFRLCHKDGHAVPVLARGFVLRAADGAAIRVSGTNTDLTERDKIQEAQRGQLAAEAANAAKTEFLSRMSHELRTPLNAVLGFSRVMLDETREPLSDRHRRQVSHIQAAGRHLHQLVSDLLDMSRIETGQLRISIEPVELASILDEVFEILGSIARPADVELVPLTLGHELPRVMADATRLRQVLFNLLSNALKYNRVGGKVWLEAAAMGERLVIGVRDSGVGMTEEQLAHLFEPYNRLGREGGRIEGVGIGLNVSRALVEMMGGKLTVNSVPGQGSSFRMSLPIAQEADNATAVDSDWAHGIDIAEPAGIVLSIEDNPVNQLLLEALLARWPQVTLLQAVTGAAGLEVMRTHQPDLVLLDMNLPDMNGLQVMEHMNADPNMHSTKVIVLSADALASDVALARERGAVNYLTKPIDPRPFFDSIAFHLGDRRTTASPDP